MKLPPSCFKRPTPVIPPLLYLPAYTLAAHTTSSIYGLTTFVRDSIRWHNMASSAQDTLSGPQYTWRELPPQMCINHLGANSVLIHCPTTHNSVSAREISTVTAPPGVTAKVAQTAIPWKTGPPSQTCHFFMIPSSQPASIQADREPSPTLT